MQIEYINSFIRSLTTLFDEMLGWELRRSGVSLHDDEQPLFEISGIIDLIGEDHWTMVISVPRDVAIRMTANRLQSNPSRVSHTEIIAVLRDMTGKVAGHAFGRFTEDRFSIGLPKVVQGKDCMIYFPSSVQPIRVFFNSTWGPLMLEVVPPVKTAPAAAPTTDSSQSSHALETPETPETSDTTLPAETSAPAISSSTQEVIESVEPPGRDKKTPAPALRSASSMPRAKSARVR